MELKTIYSIMTISSATITKKIEKEGKKIQNAHHFFFQMQTKRFRFIYCLVMRYLSLSFWLDEQNKK